MKKAKTIGYYQKSNRELKRAYYKIEQSNVMYQNILSKIFESEDVESYVNNLKKELLKD